MTFSARFAGLSLALLMVAAAMLAAFFSPGSVRPASAVACTPLTIDFATLPAGTIVTEQYAGSGVHISGQGANGINSVIVFDGQNITGGEFDLAYPGKLLINPDDLVDTMPADGLVDDPDVFPFGGTTEFDFDSPVTVVSLVYVDHDRDNATITGYDSLNNEVGQVVVPVVGNGDAQTVILNFTNVSRLVVDHDDSGGITEIVIACPQPPTTAPLTQGYWKTHEEDWPVTSLSIGEDTYNQSQLLAIFNTPPRGNATYILAHQLIATMLNLANGSSSCIQPVVNSANTFFNGSIDVGSSLTSVQRAQAISLADQLVAYNETGACP